MAADREPSSIPIEHFARLPAIKAPILSPSGDYFAYLTPFEGRHILMIRKTVSAPDASPQAISSEDIIINWARWVNDDRLIISVGFPGSRFGTDSKETRLVAVNKDGTDPQGLNITVNRGRSAYDVAQVQDKVIDMMKDDPEHIMLNLRKPTDDIPHVYRVNVYTGGTKMVERSKRRMQSWGTDPQGRIRYGYSDIKGTERKYFRLVGDDDWHEFPLKDPQSGRLFDFLKFSTDPDIVYVNTFGPRLQKQISTYDLRSGRVAEEPLFSHDLVDAEKVILAKTDGRLIGVYFIDDIGRIHYTDEKARAEQKWIDDELPSTTNTVLRGRFDHRYAFVQAQSATRPPRYFTLDRKLRKLFLLGRQYPELQDDDLSPVESFWYEARDGLQIRGYLTLPKGLGRENLPLVVLPHGGPAARDTLSFDYLSQFLASRGYAVLRMNFRGSDGYGLAFLTAGRGEWGLKMQDDVTDAVQWVIDKGLADPQRICVVGSSYGGYAALMGAVKTPGLYKCAVGLNGVYDLKRMVGDQYQYLNAQTMIRSLGLDVERGRQLKETSPYRRADEIEAMVLLLHGEDDRVVSHIQSRRMARKLRRRQKLYKFIELPGGDHYLNRAENRAAFLRELEAFLARHLGGVS